MDTGQSSLQGRRLADRYVLEEELASGGMGGLWLARDEVLGRQVAVKVLHDHLADNEELLERFRMEAVAAARLSHPAVVRVFDTGVHDGVCFIVMELVEGRTVEEELAKTGALRPAEAARIARAVLQALAHAHRQEIIHRDVKPSNILIGRDDMVKLADFGIAKTAFADGDLTTTGNLLGTSRYLSPEQVTGGEIDARSDLYSVGVVLYELLTGRPPFEAETHIATATMRLTVDPPPPGSLRPGIPRSLEAVVMGALARDPNERYQTAEEMSAALEHAVPSEATAPPGPALEEPLPPRRSARSWITVPLVLLLLAGLAVGAFLLLEGISDDPDDEPPVEASASRIRLDQAFSYDPLGDDQEHDEAVGEAIDRDEASYWTTEGYEQDLGLEKEGVGLVVQLREAATVGRVRITTATPGWDFSVFAEENPADFDHQETPLLEIDDVEGEATFEIQPPVEAEYVLIWITGLVESDGFRAHVNEVDILPPVD